MLQIGSTTQRGTPTVPVSARTSNHARGLRERCPGIWILSPPKDGLGYAASIMRRRKDGSVMWTALLPGGVAQDVWTAVCLEGPSLIANSWSCYLIRLGLETGGETARTFTK